MTVLIVGSIALDSVETPYGKHDEVLGGSATYFSLAASSFSKVRMVGVVGSDFPKSCQEFLEASKIDLRGLQIERGKTFRWSGCYEGSMNEAKTRATHLNVFQNFNPEIPRPYRKTPFVFLGNIDPELQLKVLNQIDNPVLIGLDTMNFWIDGANASLKKVLKKIGVLLINETEAKLLSGENSLAKAAEAVRRLGPKSVVIKRGEYGALLYNRNDWFFVPGYPLTKVVDPTGAGDSFAGGFMGSVARSGKVNRSTLCKAMVYGSVMASFKITEFGPYHMKKITWRSISTRYLEFRKMCSVK